MQRSRFRSVKVVAVSLAGLSRFLHQTPKFLGSNSFDMQSPASLHVRNLVIFHFSCFESRNLQLKKKLETV